MLGDEPIEQRRALLLLGDDELDTAILALMRFVDPERWNARQTIMREAALQGIDAGGREG